MNKKYSFSTPNFFKKVLFLLVGIIFSPSITHCAITSDVIEETVVEPLVRKIEPSAPPAPVVEEEIGSQTHGEITELARPASSKYEQLDWWLSVLPVIKQTAGRAELDTYEKVVKSSLNQIGLVYKISEVDYIGQMFADGLGFGIISDSFENAFNKKLEEFKLFSISYLESKIPVEQKHELECYHSNEDLFSYMIQKKDIRNVEKYEIIHIGDLHGDLISLLTILKNYEKFFNTDFSLKDKSKIFACSGDLIDRGQFGLEILFILMSLKIKNPENVYITLGNHEASHAFLTAYDQGFAREVTQKFNYGPVEFKQVPLPHYSETKHLLFGPGAEQFKNFMKKLQVNVFKYLPSVLFLKTDFGNILVCHGLPDPADTLAPVFLQLPENIQIAFGNRHPQDTRFTDNDLEVGMPSAGDTQSLIRSASAQSLQAVGKYMNQLGIFMCMRGHQHNSTIGANFDVYSGGVILHKASASSIIITTLSLDFACYIPSFQKNGKIGSYAYCCTLEKEGTTIKGQGVAIDRNTAERVFQADRKNPEFIIRSIDPEDERRAEHEKISQLYLEVEKLRVSGMPVFSCPEPQILQTLPLWTMENFHYFLNRIQTVYKININMIYELLFLFDIISQDGSLSISKIPYLSPEKKLALIQIMRDETEGPFNLISNIKKIRRDLTNSVYKINNPQKINPIIEDCLDRINAIRFSLGRKLCEIVKMLNPIQSYLNQTDELKIPIVKKIKALVSNPKDLTFDDIIIAICGHPSQDVV